MVKPLDIVGLAIGALAAVCAGLATGLPYWQTGTRVILGVTVKANYGLWRYCLKYSVAIEDDCGKTEDISDIFDGDNVDEAFDATRAMVILGLIFTSTALIPVVLIFAFKTYQKILRPVATGLFAIGGIWLMIGMAVFLGELAQDDLDHSWAFAMLIPGWVLSWIAAAVILIGFIMKDDDDVMKI